MPNCKYFLITEAEREHVRRRARFQQHRGELSSSPPLPPQGKTLKEIHAILTGTLEEHAPLNVVIFPPVMRLVLDDPKQRPPRRLLIKFTS